MGDEPGRIHALAHQVDGFAHVVCIAAAGSHDMVSFVVHVVEVELGAEVRALGAGEEVQTAIEAEDGVSLLDNRRHGGHNHDVVVACASGKFLQGRNRIAAAGVHVVDVDPALRKHLFSVK